MLDFEAEFAAFLNRDLPDIETRFDTNHSLLSLTVTKNLNQDFLLSQYLNHISTKIFKIHHPKLDCVKSFTLCNYDNKVK